MEGTRKGKNYYRFAEGICRQYLISCSKCDILVSELLGSFGDNELSPECLDGAQKFLKRKCTARLPLDKLIILTYSIETADGISIPSSYTTYIAPLSSAKLCNEVTAYKDLEHSETPYVVMFQQVSQIAEPKDIWTFHHPNRQDFEADSDPLHNLHNVRFQNTTFESTENMTMHGIAGYFESVLYKDVMISIHPKTHSPGMFSWFPIFFPLRTPVFVPQGATVNVDFWRLTDNKKVWYEWRVSQTLQVGDKKFELGTTPIHNIGGRSSWIGL
jgi:protein arginine N-methyltransferase 5